MIPIKFLFQGEVRRVSLHTNEKLNFDTLSSAACNLFPSLRERDITFLWSDEDGDVVCCSTDAEIDEAIRVMNSENKTT